MVGKKILIIEHDAIIALDLKRNFEKNGFQVAGVNFSLKEALGKMKSFKKVDLILMDLGIQDFSANCMLAERVYKIVKIPLILIASNVDEYLRCLCSKYNKVKIAKKPFKNEELILLAGNLTSVN